MVLDNLSAHKAPEVADWIAHPSRNRWHLHFTPTSSSWLNLIERWFRELTDRRLRRGTFSSVPDLLDVIHDWAHHWNADDRKIAEDKTPKEALRALKRRISDALYAAMVADDRRKTGRRPRAADGAYPSCALTTPPGCGGLLCRLT